MVNFAPTNAALLAAFLARYAVPDGVLILGPYGGKLNNDSDDVELKQPTLFPGGNPGWVRVDEVEYLDGSPWPCGTDGSGMSLQRQAVGTFGNEPGNWRAALPTAGQGNALVPAETPVVAVLPAQQVILVNQSASFTAAVLCGTPPYSYHWRFSGNDIPNATNAALVINPVRNEDEGEYRVVMTNPSGSVTSAPALFYVAKPPTITLQPLDQTVSGTETATFVAAATGTPPLAYQWRWNGTNLPGRTGPTLTLANAQPWQQGPYSVVVANAYGNEVSSEAFLTVRVPTVVLTHPTHVNIVPIPATNTLTSSNAVFSVLAAGMGPLSYQWTFWGTNLAGATGSTLTVSNVALTTAGPYAVRVSDGLTTVTSSNALLKLLTKPTITVPIVAQSVVTGGSATFSVWAVPVHPTLPLTYRWLRGGTNYVTNTYSTFLASNVTNSMTYQVVVQNEGGTDYKPPVVLSVWADADKDGLPDRWMTNYFGHTNGLAADKSRAQDDADGDGMTNLREHQAGTDPTNAVSVLRLVGVAAGGAGEPARMYFGAVSNKTYSVEYRDDVSGASWVTVGSYDSLPTNRVQWVTNELPLALTNVFYQLKVPRNN